MDSPPCKRPRLNNNFDENDNNDAAGIGPKAPKEPNAPKGPKGGITTFFHITNDDCLRRIFNELDIRTFCCLTLTDSDRFKAVAEEVFGKRFEHFKFDIESYSKSTIRCVLRHFGHLIKSIDTFNFRPTWSSWLTQLIAEKCKNSIEKLYLHNMAIDCDAMKPLMKRLKVLELNCCQFIGNVNDLLTDCPELESFHFDSITTDNNFVVQKFPKLTSLSFDGRAWMTLTRLLLLNPQIKNFHAICLPDRNILSMIVRLLSNIEDLSITPGVTTATINRENQTLNALLKLANLKRLKHLTLDAGSRLYSTTAGILMNEFLSKKISLESLHLSNFSVISTNIVIINKMKTLKTLSLHDVEVGTVDDLLSLTKELTLLEELHLQFEYNAKVKLSPTDLHKMIQCASKLSYLGVSQVLNFKIQQKLYESLLKVVRSRDEAVKLTINICGCISTNGSDVPTNIQLENEKLFNIKFESWDCNCVYCFDGGHDVDGDS